MVINLKLAQKHNNAFKKPRQVLGQKFLNYVENTKSTSAKKKISEYERVKLKRLS